MGKEKAVAVKVRGIALDKETEMPIVILQDSEKRNTMTITIGPFEASAIIIEMEGVCPPRPLTHDIITRLFTAHKFTLQNLEIYGTRGDKYLSRIRYSKGIRKYSMEIRPSDGIALALRMEAEIYVAANLLENNKKCEKYLRQTEQYSPEMLFLDAENRDSSLM